MRFKVDEIKNKSSQESNHTDTVAIILQASKEKTKINRLLIRTFN